MTHPIDYGFDAFLDALPADWYDDDALLHHLLDRYAPGADRRRLERFGTRVARRLQALAEQSALPENAPRLRHRGPYDERRDDIVLPASTLEALRVAHGEEGLGAVRGDPFVHYAMIYLLAQNGEAGVACSIACTDGLVRALRAVEAEGGDAPAAAALEDVLESAGDGYAHAAQFVTEIQGGSDVPANQVRAVPDDGAFRIHGQKWFCSNINADWFLVTARTEEEAGESQPGPLGLFLVPAFVGGHRNGYRIERLKDKLGTRALPTAEVTFDGARAWPVGPVERGLPNLLRYVLTPSRYACVVFAASALRRTERIATAYARFREAFGHPIARYPLVARTLREITAARRQALVTCFEMLRLWEAAEASGYRGQDAADFRILLSLAKPVLTRRGTELTREAMMLLAGNGIEERFSPLPRLHRDSVIMETWEGPHNVLLTQAVRDMHRFEIRPRDFLERVAGDPHPTLAARLQEILDIDDPGDAALALEQLAPAIIEAVGRGRDPEE